MSSAAARAAILAVIVGLSVAPRAQGDPRWWWDDLRLTNTPADSVTPHLVSPSYSVAGGRNVFIVWCEADDREGDLEVWMTATLDGGCTFCDPIRLTDNAVDDTNPRIAVLALPTGTWSFAVAFESAGKVLIAWDSTTVDWHLTPAEQCAAMTLMGASVIGEDKYVRFGSPGARADQPDISMAGTPAFGHFHAVWHESAAGGLSPERIWYARDLSSRGGAFWLDTPPKMLTPQTPMSRCLKPAVAVDLATDPDPLSGMNTQDRTGVSVVWLEVRPVGPTDATQLVGLRSVDSGTTFSPTGARANAPAATVSDVTSPLVQLSAPAIDAAFHPIQTSQPAWVAVAWDDTRGAGPGPEVWCDGRQLAQPATPMPDWATPDIAVTKIPKAGDGDESIALNYGFNMPTPAWIAWEDDRFGSHEISYRGGLLDPAAASAIDLSRYPFAPRRPLDPSVSTELQLSACTFDPATFECRPSRTDGDAVDVEIDGNELATYAVWSDSRLGPREIFFKRTDRAVSTAAPVLGAGCGTIGDAWVDVTFDLVASCPLPPGERMRRYLIYHGTDPGGPYFNAAAPIEVLDDPAGGSPVTRRITGLVSGTRYQVIVVPEDQARNVFPDDFDPTEDAPAAHSNEASIVTPDPCAAEPPCLWRSDVTSLLPHVPARTDVYLVPPTGEDISLKGAAYQCPIADGDLEKDTHAYDNHVALVLYQVNRPVGTLHVARSGTTLQFQF